MSKPSRYHPLLVGLHWLIAVPIIVSLLRSFFSLVHISNSDPTKIHALKQHITAGIVIVSFMTIRLIVRLVTRKPAQVSSHFASMNDIAKLTHYGFYILVFALAGTGLATAFLAGLFPIVFGQSGAPLPGTFLIFPTRIVHGWIALTLVGFLFLHVVAALYHQFIKKDHLLRRMWFGRRISENLKL